jgi:radical SAM protein with 4Fe4S-binding SPASM domain
VIQDDNLEVLPEVVDLCTAMRVKKLKFELERMYLEDDIAQAMVATRGGSDELPISSKRCTRNYSLETFRSKLYESQRRAEDAGIYLAFDPPFLMDEIEACYAANTRSTKKYICQSFRMATIAPNGNLINCFAIRKPFGNILDAPFDEVWNSEAAKTYRRKLVRNNMTPVCENCPFMTPYRGAN